MASKAGPVNPPDYTNRLPYLPGWQPLPERTWAFKYIDEDGTEDMQGFEAEFSVRHPENFSNGVPSYIPVSVDYFLRHDSKGSRLDIDWELAHLPLSEEEEAAEKERLAKAARARREAALAYNAERAAESEGAASRVAEQERNLSDLAAENLRLKRQLENSPNGEDNVVALLDDD